jgi:histidinol dehydrogenase
MNEAGVWTVDQVAAAGLLAALGLEAKTDTLEKVVVHLARHRLDACEWAAERVHDAVVRRMEAASTEIFTHHDAQWTEGFRAAEHLVLTARPAELLDLEPLRARSKGQVLRAMVREAKRVESALVVKTPA